MGFAQFIASAGLLLSAISTLAGQSYVRYSDFGAVGDGVTDDFEALVKAHAHANEQDLPVVADNEATYYIGRADRTIIIQTDTNFGEAKFIIDDSEVANHRSNVFEVRSPHQKIELDGVRSLKRGQERIDLRLSGKYLVTAKDRRVRRFIRRGGNRNRGSYQTDSFLVDRHGQVDPRTPIVWDFEQISRIEAQRVDEEQLMLRGGHFTTIAHSRTSTAYHSRGIFIQRSNVLVEGLEHHVTGEGKDGPPYSGFIRISNCANIIVRDCVLTGRKTYYKIGSAGHRVPMGSYDISINSSVNVALINVTQTNDIMDGSRWGIIGTNFCKNLIYEGCVLSRFDAHQGVTNATIRNSTLGHMGVKLTGFGTFLIENSTVNDWRLIDLRPDYGSTWRGEIIIRNCRLLTPKGWRGTPVVLNGSNNGQHDFGYTTYMPERLIIDGLEIEDSGRPDTYRGPAALGNFNPGYKEGVQLPHPQAIIREVHYRNVESTSGKPLRLSDNPEMFTDVEFIAGD